MLQSYEFSVTYPIFVTSFFSLFLRRTPSALNAKAPKRQTPKKRERAVVIYYIVPIHLLLSLLIIIYNIQGIFSYLAFWRLAQPCAMVFSYWDIWLIGVLLDFSSQLRCRVYRKYGGGCRVIVV
jgi:hypothetical protein